MRAAPPGFDLRDLLDSLRDTLRAPSRTGRAATGDVREAVLAALAEGPRHGLELSRLLDARAPGSASPGTVYPVLQQLVDEGLAASEQVGERRVFELTPAGREAASAVREGARATAGDAPRAGWMPDLGLEGPLPGAALKLASTLAQVVRDGTPEQRERAAELLDDTRRHLYSLLAED